MNSDESGTEPRVVAVEPLPGYRLRLRFDSGDVGIVDLTRDLWGPAFESLRDPQRFSQAYVDASLGTVAWPSGPDLDPDALLRSLLSRAELDSEELLVLAVEEQHVARREAWSVDPVSGFVGFAADVAPEPSEQVRGHERQDSRDEAVAEDTAGDDGALT